MIRSHKLIFVTLAALLALAATPACDDGGTSGDDTGADTVEQDTNPYLPTDTSTPGDAGDVEDDAEEPTYPGFPCEEDGECSTGLCYGSATRQGFFEPPKCQVRCIGVADFAKYCNTDADCCTGSCCIGCGADEGLCVSE